MATEERSENGTRINLENLDTNSKGYTSAEVVDSVNTECDSSSSRLDNQPSRKIGCSCNNLYDLLHGLALIFRRAVKSACWTPVKDASRKPPKAIVGQLERIAPTSNSSILPACSGIFREIRAVSI